MQSEDMIIKNNSLDLIIIMGSIEHVVDLNLVKKKMKRHKKMEFSLESVVIRWVIQSFQ